ncbi:MAG TPA: MFS transporter [Solirubrobacteraceae bacterium]|jgi:EmrB/QacA subfamily drug resistance transporter
MERRWQVLMVVVAGVFMAGLDLFIVNIAFPQIRLDFAGTSLGTLSWVLNAYTIVFAAFLVVAGRWSDAFGRKRSFLLGVGLFTAASAACAAAPSIGFLVAARAVQGFGAALLMPASLGLLLPEFPAERRHVAIGAWAAVGGIAAAAGPPLGGLLVQASWRWVFLVNVPVGLAALVAGWRVLREVRHPESSTPDFLGAGVLTVAVAALVAAIVQGQQWGWGSARIVGLLLAALLLFGIVVRRIAHHPAPIVEPALLAVRAFSVATVASVLFFAAFAAMLLACVLFLTGIWGESTLAAGLMIAPGPALAASSSVPGARLGKRLGPSRVGLAGALLFALGGVWWIVRLGAARHYATDFLPGMMIGGVGVGLTIPSLTTMVAATLPPERLATGIAVQVTGRQLGSALGAAILVAVVGTARTAQDFAGAWRLMLAASLLAGLTLALERRVATGAATAATAMATSTMAPSPGRP